MAKNKPSLTHAQAIASGLAYHRAGRLREAELLYRQVLQTDPVNAEAWHLLGVVAHAAGHADALGLVERAIGLAPENIQFLISKATIQEDRGDTAAAADTYRALLEIDPAHAQAHNNLGNLERRTQDAIKHFRRAIELNPSFAEALYNLALCLQNLGDYVEAIRVYREALVLRPDFAYAHNNIGSCLRAMGRNDEALIAIQEALRLDASLVPALYNRAGLDLISGRFREAEAGLRQVIELAPDMTEARYDRGVALDSLGEVDEAIRCYRELVALAPGHARAHNNLAMALLLRGDFAQAWSEYAWRLPPAPVKDVTRSTPAPAILGRLAVLHSAQTLVLQAEQGIGDNIFFLRCAPMLRAHGTKLFFSGDKRLVPLLRRSGIFSDCLEPDSPLPQNIDLMRIGDLPLLLDLHDPASVPPLALSPLDERVAHWRTVLHRCGPGPYVGLTWRAGTRHSEISLHKEIPLDALASALRDVDATFVSLQRIPKDGELENLCRLLGKQVHDCSAANEYLEDILALLTVLDEYVGVSNTNMHLRASLGRTAQVLVPFPPEWRWLFSADQSPWFPGFRIYGQQANKDWQTAMERLAHDLRGRTKVDTPAVSRPPSVRAARELLNAGRIDEAADSCARILIDDPGNADAHHLLGIMALQRGQLDQARERVARAISIAPRREAYHLSMGQILVRQECLDEGVACYRKALELRPAFAEAHNSLGVAWEKSGKLEHAEQCYQAAIAAQPGFAQAYFNLGNTLRKLGRSEAATEHYRRAVVLRPGFAEAHYMLGKALVDRGRFQDAMASYRRAIAVSPAYAPAHEALSHMLLASGDFAQGWEEYEWRSMRIPAQSGADPAAARRMLSGRLDGLPFVLFGEQGLGDVLFFLRAANAMKARGALLHYWGDDRLIGMLKRTGLFERFWGTEERPDVEVQYLQMGELPRLLGWSEAGGLPGALRLGADAARVENMRARLGGLGPGRCIGITWRAGSKAADHALFKEIPLEPLGHAVGAAHANLISLQRNPLAGETEALGKFAGREVHDWSALNDDLEDMLALLTLLDDYVAVSNTNVHLRAGAGLTARVLVPHPPEWRWMLQEESSPWFPGFGVYRQKPDGDWSAALNVLRAELPGSIIQRGAS